MSWRLFFAGSVFKQLENLTAAEISSQTGLLTKSRGIKTFSHII